METTALLQKLTAAVGVSGAENEIGALLCDLLQEYGTVSTDDMHNVFCTFGEGYHFLLDAHLDEIGFIVTAVTDDGFVKVSDVGGVDHRMLIASEVSVWGSKNGVKEYRGVIATLPPHLQKDGEKKPLETDDICIDIGFTKEEAEQRIALGDRVTFKRNFNRLLHNQLNASVLDDRSGVAAILTALPKLKDVPAKVTVMFSSQEEVGIRGAKIGPYGKNVDEAIAVDVSFGYTPLCKKSDCGEVGGGAMIGYSPILDREMSDKLVAVAEKEHINYQREIMGGGRTGTNADAISISESGIRTALISIPEKYMHSPAEIVDVHDVEAVSDLIAAYVRERAGEKNA